MRPICSVEVVRAAEAGAGVPEPVLMQRASHALAAVCRALLGRSRATVRGGHVVALVGTGNNGGDALWALSFLGRRGARTTIVGDPARLHPAGAEAARLAGARVLDWADPAVLDTVEHADLILDGILGIGGRGGVRPPAAEVVSAVNAAAVPVVAVDVPSGVDADTGAAGQVAVRATATVCFGVLKPGLVLSPGREHAGVVTVPDIGLRRVDLAPSAHALDLGDLTMPVFPAAAHKYRRGVVQVVAGSPTYPGAALLAVDGAAMTGVGMVTFASQQSLSGRRRRPASGGAPQPDLDPVAALVVARHPQVVLSADRRVDARCVGPGLGDTGDVAGHVVAAMADPAPLVIDASALPVLARPDGRAALAHRGAAGWVTVLTPHAGEFARLGFEVTRGRMAAAEEAAAETGAVVVLKGPGTVIAAPECTFVDTFGDANLATAGTGDVLAGLLAGLLAGAAAGHGPAGGSLTRTEAALVAARAVGLHGLAGRLAADRGGPVLAADLVTGLRQAHATAAAASA